MEIDTYLNRINRLIQIKINNNGFVEEYRQGYQTMQNQINLLFRSYGRKEIVFNELFNELHLLSQRGANLSNIQDKRIIGYSACGKYLDNINYIFLNKNIAA